MGQDVQDHPNPYPLGQLHKDVELKVTKQCKIKFSISVDFIDEIDLDVVPLDVCEVMFGSPYIYIRDEIFMRRANQYRLIKDGKSFIINAHKGKSKISLVSANQPNKIYEFRQEACFIVFKKKSICRAVNKWKGIPRRLYYETKK